MNAWRHVRAIVLLPGVVAVAVPAVIVVWAGTDVGLGWEAPWSVLPVLAGAVLIVAGGALWYATVRLFAREGEGTLAPWDPTRRLVVAGPYRHVRNPMITGVLAVLAGEAALLGSPWIAAWSAIFFAVNLAWCRLVEEPGLVQRFGAEYEEYRRAVPGWLPRRTPWTSR